MSWDAGFCAYMPVCVRGGMSICVRMELGTEVERTEQKVLSALPLNAFKQLGPAGCFFI